MIILVILGFIIFFAFSIFMAKTMPGRRGRAGENKVSRILSKLPYIQYRVINDVLLKTFLELYNAYYNSLLLLKDNGLHSISFPLISSGIFGGNLPDPAGESAKQCGRAYKKFVQDYPDYEIDVMLCAFKPNEFQDAQSALSAL